jgi:hypothetical protein
MMSILAYRHLISMAGLAIFVVFAFGSVPAPERTADRAPKRTAKFVTLDMDIESCGRLFDVCAKATCSVENRGEVAGIARVRFWFNDNGTEISAYEEEVIAAGQLKKVVHEFPELTYKTSSDTKIKCSAEPK